MAKLTRRDFLKLGGAALLGLAGSRFVPPRDYTEYFDAPLLWHGSRSYKNIAFTYDDCNSLSRMQKLEALLDEHPGAKATFFPVGLKIPDLEKQDAGIWKRLVEKGHEIGYHSYEHVNLLVMSEKGVLEDFDRWQAALDEALGMAYPTRFVRPPYDIISPTLNYLCHQRGLVAALFSVGGGGKPDVVLRGIQKAQGGDIVQMHIRTEDYESSKLAFPWLQENNWELVTMGKLYDVYLREQVNPDGCDLDADSAALTRTCLE
jgi:peptidoglycan/xylan/chitin deacetylase (PgdA/CDA1 family)